MWDLYKCEIWGRFSRSLNLEVPLSRGCSSWGHSKDPFTPCASRLSDKTLVPPVSTELSWLLKVQQSLLCFQRAPASRPKTFLTAVQQLAALKAMNEVGVLLVKK